MPADSGYGVPGTGAPRWEYRVERLEVVAVVALSNFGAEGWELVAVVPVRQAVYFYFKRKK